MNDEKLAGKFDAADKSKLESAVNDTISWLDSSQEASKEEYEEKQKELEGIAKYVFLILPTGDDIDLSISPIMQKLYGSAGGAGGPGGFPGAGGFPGGAPGGFPGADTEDGPSVEEVD